MASGYSVYEEENEHLQEGLRAKVHALKSVSIVKCLIIGECHRNKAAKQS